MLDAQKKKKQSLPGDRQICTIPREEVGRGGRAGRAGTMMGAGRLAGFVFCLLYMFWDCWEEDLSRGNTEGEGGGGGKPKYLASIACLYY